MAKSNPFSEQDLINKGFVKGEDGTYAKSTSDYEAAVKKIKESISITPKNESIYSKAAKFPIHEVKQEIDEFTHLGIKSKHLVVFNITPIGAPRMTQSDKWKLDPYHKDPKRRQRKAVTQYFKFKTEINRQATLNNFKLPESGFHVIFIIPMPHSWVMRKRNNLNNTPHQQKPDCDNMIKAVKDSLCKNDANIWDYRITKYWGNSGKIIIYEI